MLQPEVIVEEAQKNEEPTIEMNLIELNLFLTIRKLIILYQINGIPKDTAARLKTKAVNMYLRNKQEYEFWENLFKKHVEINKKTEAHRIKLHKLLNEKEDVISKEKLVEIVDACMNIICIDYEKEFNYKGELNVN